MRASDANEIHIPCGIHPQHEHQREHLLECLFQWLAIPRCEDIGVAYCTSLAGEEDSSGSPDPDRAFSRCTLKSTRVAVREVRNLPKIRSDRLSREIRGRAPEAVFTDRTQGV